MPDGNIANKEIKEVYRDLLHLNNSNAGVSTALKPVTTGNNDATALNVSTTSTGIKSKDNTTAFTVSDRDDNNILLVDTTNDRVKVGATQLDASLGFKEFGLFDFSPSAGYHQPMVAMNGLTSVAGNLNVYDTSMFSNGADPATTLDLSSDGTGYLLLNSLWRVPENMTILEARVLGAGDGAQALNFHIYSYVMATGADHGDLSDGTLHAHIASSMSVTNSTIKMDTLTLDSASVTSGRFLIAFCEAETDATDFTCTLTLQYRFN